MHPRLKRVAWQREGDDLRLVYDIREQFVLEDPDGVVEALIVLLEEGGRTPAQLAQALDARFASQGTPISTQDVEGALAMLDEQGLVEVDDVSGAFTPEEQERYFSNLAFFESFSSLEHGQGSFQRRMRESHVLFLGTGGLNSNTIPHLCGLGVGRVTLLDRDAVEPRNFARQFLYTHADVGQPKVEVAAQWVRDFDPSIKVEAVTGSVTCTEDVTELLERFRPDVVMCGIDQPNEVGSWVNAGCVAAGTPFVRAGMRVTTGIVLSVDPGRSGCLDCTGILASLSNEDWAAADLNNTRPRTNRGIGPIAGLLGSLSAFELLRYLTRYEAPAYAGRQLVIDFADGCDTTVSTWERSSDCPTCASAPARA